MALRFNRGHQQSTRSNSVSSAREANNSSASTSKLGASSMKFVQRYLDECRSFYSCIYCRTHLANHDELISRSFQGNRSRAYLFNSVVNVSCGPSVQRELNTGSHSVADIFCTNCGTTIGWKYEKAFVDSQRYKEGKYIIELAHVVRENRHLELDKRDIFLGLVPQVSSQITNSAPPEKQQAANCNGDATIGTNHQGSLSPASSSGGQWSPGTSSASTSSSSSSSSNEMDTLRPSCRYETTASERRQQWLVVDDLDNDDPDEIDDDEVLMFPFYDDFYGNRSSYSNLSTTRNHQKRLRRSLYLENTMAPYDLTRHTYAAGGSTSSSSVSQTAAAAAAVERAGPTLQTRETPQRPTRLLETPNLCPSSACSSSFIEIPVLNHQTGHQTQQSDNNNSSRQQLAANRRFFASASSRSSPLEIIPPQPTSALSPSTANNIKGDSGTNSELATRAHTSSFSNHQLTDHPVDDEDTQFEFEHDKQPAAVVEIEQTQAAAGTSTNASLDYRRDSNQSKHSIQPDGQETNCELITLAVNCSEVESSSTGLVRELSSHASSSVVDDASSNGPSQVTAMDVSETSSSSRSMAKTQSSLSFDDEEFYDCNTDHDISNTNSLETTNK